MQAFYATFLYPTFLEVLDFLTVNGCQKVPKTEFESKFLILKHLSDFVRVMTEVAQFKMVWYTFEFNNEMVVKL